MIAAEINTKELGRTGESDSNQKQLSVTSKTTADPAAAPAKAGPARDDNGNELIGTAKAVPFQNVVFEASASESQSAWDTTPTLSPTEGEGASSDIGTPHIPKVGICGAPVESKGRKPVRGPNGRFAKGGTAQTAVEQGGTPHIRKEGICGPATSESQGEGDGTPTLSPTEGDKGGAAAKLAEEKVRRLTAFVEQPPKVAAPKTDKEKKLAKERKRVAQDVALLTEFGEELDNMEPRFSIQAGGRARKVAAREYMMAQWLKIRNKNGRLQALRVNAAQREYAKTAAKRNIVLKARQLGITTYVAARFFLNCITRPGTLCVQVAHDRDSAEEIFRIVHRLLANLPEHFRKGVLATSHANVRQIIFPHLDSSYRVETAADENAGRGLTIHNLHCSEVARWPRDAAATLASLRAAVPPDGEIVLESTANGACGCFYEEWQSADQKGYSRHFYPWWWEPGYKRQVEIVEFTEPELELMAKYGLTAEQIAFRREVRANFGQRAAEEYAEDAESCFRASGECYFDLEVVEQRLREPVQPVEQTDNGRLFVFLPPQGEKEYIIGVDPAGGGAHGDYSVAQVIERASGLQCAELRGHVDRQELAARVAILARDYNQALVAVERNNHGSEVLGYLGMNYNDVPLYTQKKQAGWLTTAASRPLMLLNFAAVLAAAPLLFVSQRLLEECKTFVRRPDGSSAAANGAHDDTVMAMAIAQAVRTELAGRPAAAKAQLEVATL